MTFDRIGYPVPMCRKMLSLCKKGGFMRFLRMILAIMALLIATSGLCHGSLGQGHVYVAEKLMAKMPPQLKQSMKLEKNAYLAGANGVDIIYWSFFKCSTIDLWTKKPIPPHDFDQHRNYTAYQAGIVALDILQRAKNSGAMKDKAFAVGWFTHWLVDAYAHTLIGHYGGDYGTDEGEYKHTQMEIVESKHLCNISSKDSGRNALLNNYFLAKDHIPQDFLLKLYEENKFVPTGFDSDFIKNCGGRPLPENLLGGFNEVRRAILCNQISCRSGTAKCVDPNEPEVQTVALTWATFKGAQLLSNEDYGYINKAIRILEAPKVEDNKIKVDVEVNDTQLYGKFLVEWDRVISDLMAFADKTQLFQKIGDFLGGIGSRCERKKRRSRLSNRSWRRFQISSRPAIK